MIAVDTAAVGQHKGIVTVDSDGGAATIRVTATMDPPSIPAPEPSTVAVRQPPTTGPTTPGRVQQPPSPPPPALAYALPVWQVDQGVQLATGGNG